MRTVSTTGATGCFTFRAAFFTGARLALALAAAFAALRALPRLAEFALRRFARLCTLDPFLRLAMIALWSGSCSATRIDSPSPGKLSNEVINRIAVLSAFGLARYPFSSRWRLEGSPPPVRQTLLCRVHGVARHVGDESKAVGCVSPTALLFVALWQRPQGILILSRRHRLTVISIGRECLSFLHDVPQLPRLAGLLVSLFLSCDLRAPRRSMQDQQN